MNPQPNQSTVNAVTIIFVLMVLFFAATTKKRFRISDKFDLIYEVPNTHKIFQEVIETPSKITNSPKPTKITNSPKPKKNKKTTVKTKVSEVSNSTHTTAVTTTTEPPKFILSKDNFDSIHADCREALMSLGMKKKEATDTVIRIFNNYEVVSIEDFIKKAFAPDEYN